MTERTCRTCARPGALRHEFTEVGGVLAAAGGVHAFAAAVSHYRYGGLVLLGLGLTVLAGALLYRLAADRRRRRQQVEESPRRVGAIPTQPGAEDWH